MYKKSLKIIANKAVRFVVTKKFINRLSSICVDDKKFANSKLIGNAQIILKSELSKWLSNYPDTELSLLDVGGGDGEYLKGFLGDDMDRFHCYNLDLEDHGTRDTIICDITKPIDQEMHEKFFCIHSCDAFEHFAEPWIAADNIARLLAPGGICLIRTVFSWRYHPSPNDFYRFSDEALNYLFSVEILSGK